MLRRIASLVTKNPVRVILAWLVLMGVAVLFAPSLREVGTIDEASFLPKGTEALRARDLIIKHFPGSDAVSSGAIIFHNPDGLSDDDLAYAREVRDWLLSAEAPESVESVASIFDNPQLKQILISSDNTTMLMQLGFSEVAYEAKVMDAVASIRSHLDGAPPGLEIHVSGQAGIFTDLFKAIMRSIDLTTWITVVLIIVLLLIIYRSPVAALVPLTTITAAFLVARGALGYLAEMGVNISSQLDAFLIVLVFGVGTDYCLFIISRFREELRRQESRFEANVITLQRIGAVITASAATVIVGFVGMGIGSFEMIRTMGPSLGLAIFVTLLAALTLTPALISLFGRRLFWPFQADPGERKAAGPFNWGRVARLATRWPGVVAVVVIAVLLVPYLALPGLQRSYNTLAEIPEDTDSVAGFRVLERHYDLGEMMPLTAVIESGEGQDLTSPASLASLAKVSEALRGVEGVATVRSLVQPDGRGERLSLLTVSGQLDRLREKLTPSTPNVEADPAALLTGAAEESFRQLKDYLGELASEFSWVEEEPSYQEVRRKVQDLTEALAKLKEQALVENQLRGLSRQMSAVAQIVANPAQALGGDSAQALAPIQGYLNELGEAYPEVKADQNYQDAQDALGDVLAFFARVQMGQGGQLPPDQTQAALLQLQNDLQRLSTDLERLADSFAGQEAYLFPKSLSQAPKQPSPQEELQAQLATFGERLEELSARFRDEGDPYFLPKGLLASIPEAQGLLDVFLAEDNKAAQLQVVLASYPYSEASIKTVRRLRKAFHASLSDTPLGGGDAAIGGPTAQTSDIQQVMDEDFNRVAVVVLSGIFVVLVILLRSLVAPIYLLATVLLSYGTTLGVVTWVFQGVLGHEGVGYMIPLIVFVMLVALGEDYNIFLISRVKEESQGRPTREGARLAAAATGGVISACGIILAGTFGALASAPIRMLFQIGVAVAIGILIDTFIVRGLLVPAIAARLGRWNWWPSRRASED